MHASLAAALGNVAAARGYASAAERAMSEAGDVVGITHLRIAVATLELSLGDPDAAWQTLERSAGTTGVHRDFVLVRVVPCAIEALVALGQIEQAAALAQGLEEAESILARAGAGQHYVHARSSRHTPIVTAPLCSSRMRSPRTSGSEADSKGRVRCSRGDVFSGGGSADAWHASHSRQLVWSLKRWVRDCGRFGSPRSSNEQRHAERSMAS
jgi:hypothetical protein